MVRSCDFSLAFLLPLHISAAAAMSQDVEATDGLCLPTAVVPCCSEDVVAFLGVLTNRGVAAPQESPVCLSRSGTSARTPTYTIYSVNKSIFSPRLWRWLPRSQTISLFPQNAISKVSLC